MTHFNYLLDNGLFLGCPRFGLYASMASRAMPRSDGVTSPGGAFGLLRFASRGSPQPKLSERLRSDATTAVRCPLQPNAAKAWPNPLRSRGRPAF